VIRNGDRLENPVTGEVLIFHRTSRDTGGEYVLVEGRLGLRAGDRELVAGPGEVVTVEPRTPHRFWNAGDSEVRFVCEVRPALEFESLIETMFSLAAEGKTNRKGMPNPFRLAVIARSHFDTVRLPFPPAWVQRAGLALGAPLGRLAGYRPAVA
jgi:hypothetical protein